MGYYFLKPGTEKGKSACVSHKDAGFLFLKDSQSDLDYFEFPDFEPIFSGLNLEKGSVIVDCIYDGGGFGGRGFILSEKAVDVIKGFSLPPHRFYPLPAYVHKNNAYRYYWMQILVKEDNFEFIDFTESVFQIDFWEPEPDGRSEEFRFANAEEMEAAYKKYHLPGEMLYEQEIALSAEFYAKSPDLFYIDYVFDTFVISEKLKNALEQNNITGFADFYENMPAINGNNAQNQAGGAIDVVQKDAFEPATISEVTSKLDYIFEQMAQDENAVYDYDQEIEASLAFLSQTDNPIQPVFARFEKYPDAMQGAPGPFVHYLESFYGNGLEVELLASLDRNPTSESINMAFRIASDKANPEQKRYVSVLRHIARNHPDEYIAQTAQDCLDDL